VNTVVMFFSARTKKLPFRLLQARWLDTAGFGGFGIHAPTMVEPKRGGSSCNGNPWVRHAHGRKA
jgi:hypothetical protein